MRRRTSLLLTATMTAVLLLVVTACAGNDPLQKIDDVQQKVKDVTLTPLAGCPVGEVRDPSKIMDIVNEVSNTKKIVFVASATIIQDVFSMRSESGAELAMYMVNADGTSLTRLTKTTAEKYGANRLPDGRKLNIAWDTNGRKIMSIDYGGTRSETLGLVGYCSPDGKKGVFPEQVSTSTAEPDSGPESDDLYVQTDNGTKKLKGTAENGNDTDESEPTFSPDSGKLAFMSDGDVFVASADGSHQRNLTNSGAEEHSPAWSPDSEKLAFIRDGNVYVASADGMFLNRIFSPTKLTDNASALRGLVFSPSGKQIAFPGSSAGGSIANLYVINADGTGLTNLTDKVTRSDKATGAKVSVESSSSPSLQPYLFSPDSKQIAFLRSSYVPTRSVPLPTYESDLYAVNVDGTDLTRLTYTETPTKNIVTWVWK